VKLDVLKRLTRACTREFSFGRAVGVVEGGFRGRPFGDVSQVRDRVGVLESGGSAIESWPLDLNAFEA
jgi:hypothetical protein